MTPEGKVKKEIKDGLTARGIYFFMPVQTGYGRRSLDFICCWNGKFLAIEAKAGKNVPSRYQMTTMSEIEMAGGRVCVAYSWQDVENLLWQVEHGVMVLGSAQASRALRALLEGQA